MSSLWKVSNDSPLIEDNRKRKREPEEVDLREESDSESESDLDSFEDDFVVSDDDEIEAIDFPEFTLAELRAKYRPEVLDGGGLVIQASSIEGAGLGLFANRDFARGEPITEYYGQLIDNEEAKKRLSEGRASHILPLVNFEWYVDGLFHPSGIPIADPVAELSGRGAAAFINSTRGTNLADNARFDFSDTAINQRIMDSALYRSKSLNPTQRLKYARAVREIKKGEEILIDYGLVGMPQ